MPIGIAAGMMGAGILGGYLQGEAMQGAAETQSNAQLEAARIAAEQARFKPIGVSGYYGSSNFQFDDKGNLIGAGYDLSPEARAQQQRLGLMANQGLSQYEQAFGQSQRLGQAGNRMFDMGMGYLGTSPQEQAQKYMAEQQGLLTGSRERQLADIRNQLQQTGRAGLAVGGTSQGDMAANPELAAYYNAIAQQDRELAAAATKGGMEYAQFGQGMMGAGAGSYGQMYGMQQAAMAPYAQAQQAIGALEEQGQGMMNMGANLGGGSAQAGATQGQMLQSGANAAANAMYQANAYSPLGAALSGAGNMGMQYAMSGRGGYGGGYPSSADTAAMYNARPLASGFTPNYTPYASTYQGV